MSISFNFYVQQFEKDVYQHAKVQKVFQSSKENLAKNKVISNHVEQSWILDMVNFKIDFLWNHN